LRWRRGHACNPRGAPALSELAVEEAIAESGLGARRRFPGPLFLAVAPVVRSIVDLDVAQLDVTPDGQFSRREAAVQ
jgi:hypothetical protein